MPKIHQFTQQRLRSSFKASRVKNIPARRGTW